MAKYRIEFPGTTFQPLELESDAELSLALTAANSPILFGCRSGICGTCLVEAKALNGELPPPCDGEAEALSIYAPGNPNARLACQIPLATDISLRKIAPE